METLVKLASETEKGQKLLKEAGAVQFLGKWTGYNLARRGAGKTLETETAKKIMAAVTKARAGAATKGRSAVQNIKGAATLKEYRRAVSKGRAVRGLRGPAALYGGGAAAIGAGAYAAKKRADIDIDTITKEAIQSAKETADLL
jgi:hypothetical protein